MERLGERSKKGKREDSRVIEAKNERRSFLLQK